MENVSCRARQKKMRECRGNREEGEKIGAKAGLSPFAARRKMKRISWKTCYQNEFQTLLQFFVHTVSDSISLFYLPKISTTTQLNDYMYIEGFVYCWLSRSFVFLELFTLFECVWDCVCVCRYMERFSINVSERV